jgi:glutamyl-tRNA reductase
VSRIQTDLPRIQVRSATFRDHTPHERAELANRLRDLRADEHVLLETCHRVELVTVGDDPQNPPASAVGRDAVRRTFEVVGGLDSAVIAEEQLLGQARDAYESALAGGGTGPILNELYRRALRFGRRVRSHAQPGAHRSLADPGVAWLLARIPASASVVVCGTGEMGRRLAARLADAGARLTVVSSSAERGALVLAACAGAGHTVRAAPLSRELIAEADAIALAVRSAQPGLPGRALPPGRLPWVLDVSSPSAVDTEAVGRLGERLLRLEDLTEMAEDARALSPAIERRLRSELTAEVDAFVAWLDARRSAGAQWALFAGAEEVRRRHLDRLRRGGTLDERQMAAVEAASAAMLGELLHGPSVELRRGGADAATVRRLFGIEQ